MMNYKQYERLYRSFLEEWKPKLTVCKESLIHFNWAFDDLKGQSSDLNFVYHALLVKKELLEEILLKFEFFEMKGDSIFESDDLSGINEEIQRYKKWILKLIGGYEGLASVYKKNIYILDSC